MNSNIQLYIQIFFDIIYVSKYLNTHARKPPASTHLPFSAGSGPSSSAGGGGKLKPGSATPSCRINCVTTGLGDP